MPQLTETTESTGAATTTTTKAKRTNKKGAKAKQNGKAKKGGRAKKEGLRKPQIRVLQVLKGGAELTRAQIADKGEVDQAFLTTYIGSEDPKIRAKRDKQMMPSLLTLGYVKSKCYPTDGGGEGPAHYTITASGKAAYEKAVKK